MLPGDGINDLPQAVEMTRAGARDHEFTRRAQDPGKFGKIRQRKNIQDTIEGTGGKRQVNDAGDEPVDRLIALRGLADPDLGDVDAVVPDAAQPLRAARQGIFEPLEIKALPAAGVKNAACAPALRSAERFGNNVIDAV
jgi:hypothetical protein